MNIDKLVNSMEYVHSVQEQPKLNDEIFIFTKNNDVKHIIGRLIQPSLLTVVIPDRSGELNYVYLIWEDIVSKWIYLKDLNNLFLDNVS